MVRMPVTRGIFVRERRRRLGLPTADKPQMACLSSRIPHGEAVTPEKLRMIEEAEYVLRDLGFYDVRVRHHELGSQKKPETFNVQHSMFSVEIKHLARIEVGAMELPRLLD